MGENPSFVRRQFVLSVRVSQGCLQTRMQHMGRHTSCTDGSVRGWARQAAPSGLLRKEGAVSHVQLVKNKNKEAGKKNSVKITSENRGI